MLSHGRQPDCIFDFAYEAQSASVRNRLGGKINYGAINLLVPIVTAQVLEFLDTGETHDVELPPGVAEYELVIDSWFYPATPKRSQRMRVAVVVR